MDHSELLRVLHYNPLTGLFIWKVIPNRYDKKIGDQAQIIDSRGYCHVRLFGRSYLAHRVAWFHINGKWPSNQLDHINGVKSDNRIANLREATAQQNALNNTVYSNNQSGRTGVSLVKRRKKMKWQAFIRRDRRLYHLGYFDSFEQAALARRNAEITLFGPWCR